MFREMEEIVQHGKCTTEKQFYQLKINIFFLKKNSNVLHIETKTGFCSLNCKQFCEETDGNPISRVGFGVLAS